MKLSSITLALLVTCTASPYTFADTTVQFKIINNTYGTLKLKQYGGLESDNDAPLVYFNVGPGTEEVFTITYDRAFTYDKPGWQPTRKRIAPISNFIDYEVNGYRCRLKTSLSAPIASGALESSYKPTWEQTSAGRGTPGYSCNSYFSERKSNPPFNYDVVLTFNK